MMEILLANLGFVVGYMICSIVRNIEKKKDKKIPFKKGIK